MNSSILVAGVSTNFAVEGRNDIISKSVCIGVEKTVDIINYISSKMTNGERRGRGNRRNKTDTQALSYS